MGKENNSVSTACCFSCSAPSNDWLERKIHESRKKQTIPVPNATHRGFPEMCILTLTLWKMQRAKEVNNGLFSGENAMKCWDSRGWIWKQSAPAGTSELYGKPAVSLADDRDESPVYHPVSQQHLSFSSATLWTIQTIKWNHAWSAHWELFIFCTWAPSAFKDFFFLPALAVQKKNKWKIQSVFDLERVKILEAQKTYTRIYFFFCIFPPKQLPFTALRGPDALRSKVMTRHAEWHE